MVKVISNLLNSDVPLSLHKVEFLLRRAVDSGVVEATGDAAILIANSALEVVQELFAFVVLNFTVLDGASS